MLGNQAGLSKDDLDICFPITVLTTSGDKLKGKLSEFGGKGLFTKELEEALLARSIDMAVHSMKDVPTVGHTELDITAILKRADARDGFISPKAGRLADLSKGAVLGTASLRRQAQALHLRPDLKTVLLRGNVDTRIRKLNEGVCDATFLACAGLQRLGKTKLITHIVPIDEMLPAPAQGAIGIEIRKDNTLAKKRLAALDHVPTRIAITAERAFLRALDGSCRTPIAAYAHLEDGDMHFRGEVYTQNGQQSFTCQTSIALGDEPLATSYACGWSLGRDIKNRAGAEMIWNDI